MDNKNSPSRMCHLLQHDKIEYYTDLCDSLEGVKNYVDDSHLRRSLAKCTKCGQLFFHEFLEKVDYIDGNDPQYWTWIPVKNESEAEILNHGDSLHLNALYGLFMDWPSDVPEAPKYATLRNQPETIHCSALDILDAISDWDTMTDEEKKAKYADIP